MPHWHGDKFNFDLCPTGMVTISTLIIAPLLLCQIPDLSPNYLVSKSNFNLSLDFTRSGDPPARSPRHEDAHIHRTHRCTCTHPRTQITHTGTHAHVKSPPHTHTYIQTHTQTHTFGCSRVLEIMIWGWDSVGID